MPWHGAAVSAGKEKALVSGLLMQVRNKPTRHATLGHSDADRDVTELIATFYCL